MMNIERMHMKILQDDLDQDTSLCCRMFIGAKLLYYCFQRKVWDWLLRKFLEKQLRNDAIYKKIDLFLLNDGGLFKKYSYGKCNKFYPLKEAVILVPGVGYGRNIFQLAAFRPKKIIAFDLFAYPKEWMYLIRKVKEAYGVELVVMRVTGTSDPVLDEYIDMCDFILNY